MLSVKDTQPLPTHSLLFVLFPGFSSSTHTNEENKYGTVLACWASQEEVDTDSSSEEADISVNPDQPVGGDPASNLLSNANKCVHSVT